jgi:TPR repeat protein
MIAPRLTAPIAACLAFTAGAPALAGPIDVTFTPPEMTAQDLCKPRPPGHEVRARWQDWNGDTLGERSDALVRRDMRLLRGMDAKAWFDTIERAQELLAERSDSYGEADRLRDRLSLLTEAGRTDQIREEGVGQALVDAAPMGSGSVKTTAAALLSEGRAGVEKDEDAALSLLRSAAYEGNPNAIIELAAMSAAGVDVPDWTIEPDVAVTMAFGAKIGDADPLVCDRINQIASSYASGEVVETDHELAERWYRFSASLGDYNAAWEVAQYHMRAEVIDKDNDVLMDHLRQAAAGHLPYAITELAQVLQRGALADRDIARAKDLYEEAAGYGDMTAYTRLASIAREESDGSAEDLARRIARLGEIIEQPDPPAWAFARLSDAVLERDGRWAGEARAQALTKRALEIDPQQSLARLQKARMDLRYVDTPEAVAALTSSLRAMVRENGHTEFMQGLQYIYHCRAPQAPEPDKAEIWYEAEAFSGDMTITSEALAAKGGGAPTDTLVVTAQLQSQALSERSRSLANLLEQLGEGAEDGLSDLIAMSAENGEPVNAARGRAAMRQGDRDAARRWLERAVEAGEEGARVDLAKFYADPETRDVERDQILRLATEAAHTGNGAAIELLLEVDPAMDASTAWETFGPDIERNGDARALIFALPHLDDPERIDDYVARIGAVIPCDGGDAVRMVNAMTALDRPEAARHWLDVARVTAAGVDWEMVAVGDALLEHADLYEGAEEAARELYREAAALDYPLAYRKLLSMRKDGQADIPVSEATELWTAYLGQATIEDIPSALRLLSFAEPELKAEVEERVDVRGLYTTAAEKGNPTAQLELAKIILDEQGQDGAERYAELLTASAEQGQDEAMMLLSEAYAYGIGVETDTEQSRQWLERAAEAGNPTARSRVDLLTNERTTE